MRLPRIEIRHPGAGCVEAARHVALRRTLQDFRDDKARHDSVRVLPTVAEADMNAFTAEGERILSVHTVAIRLGVADRTVRLWAARGWLAAFKDGPKIWR